MSCQVSCRFFPLRSIILPSQTYQYFIDATVEGTKRVSVTHPISQSDTAGDAAQWVNIQTTGPPPPPIATLEESKL
ncbi:hypothetical protein BO85DRAFT_454421 [Aspergillus piperis CBS 112811]|uniref:Uncharacterized protein n=1 Tax=Aspergillus piperis CBS 112811 TaxID=1448313 RepID=A0A8G1QS76_9EURO|nr:hypothetical protein BO85DRAFT_454421 [Aspergillus piperis CBS 112811]RAH51867.1 hypothetical protein BO85DRAFT_454421 [Aspergillus piperis CBS 112811]